MPTAPVYLLKPHPAHPAPAGLGVEVTVTPFLTDDAFDLRLDYCLIGARTQVCLPPPEPAQACDGLWQHTCCEAFIATVDGQKYREFNFSPSHCWAVYDFLAYRQRDTSAQHNAGPRIETRHDGDDFCLRATLPASLLPSGAAHLGLSVVIETLAGDKLYWALHHPAPQPDFHHADNFVLPLSL